MDIKISDHAKQRMDERGVSEKQVKSFFDANEPIISWKISDSDNSVILVDTVFDEQEFRLVYNALTDTLITLYPRR